MSYIEGDEQRFDVQWRASLCDDGKYAHVVGIHQLECQFNGCPEEINFLAKIQLLNVLEDAWIERYVKIIQALRAERGALVSAYVKEGYADVDQKQQDDSDSESIGV